MHRGRKVLPVRKDLLDRKVHKACRATLELLVRKALRETLAPQALQDRKVHKVLKETPVHKGLLVLKDRQDLEDLLLLRTI